MDKKQKITLLTGLLIIIAVFVVWLSSGGELFTKTQVLIEKKDELFGTTYKEWKDQFIWGLDYTLYVTGATVFLCGILFLIFRKNKVTR
jgi:hypothetical protein